MIHSYTTTEAITARIAHLEAALARPTTNRHVMMGWAKQASELHSLKVRLANLQAQA